MRSFSELASLKGRVALVAGGASAMGRLIAGALAEQGAAVTLVDRPGSSVEDTARALTDRYGVLATSIAVDGADDAAIRKVPQRVVDTCGRLDIVVAIVEDTLAPLEQQAAASVALPVQLIQQAEAALRASGKGSVIVVGPGLSQLAGWLATGVASNIRVNGLSFSKGREEDARGACVFLASDLSAHVTGQCIVVAAAN